MFYSNLVAPKLPTNSYSIPLKSLRPYLLILAGLFSLITLVWAASPGPVTYFTGAGLVAVPDTGKKDTSRLPYPFPDRYADPYNSRTEDNPMYLSTPDNIKTTIEYNPDDRQYDVYEKMGDRFFRSPSYMTFEEFKESEFSKSTEEYWKQKANSESVTQKKGFSPKLYVPGEAFNRIFGGNTIDIRKIVLQ